MSKTTPFQIRLSPVELSILDQQARGLGMTKTAYARMLLVATKPEKSEDMTSAQGSAQPTAEHAEIAERMGLVEVALAEQEAAFVTLIEHLREQFRQPSFSEFRARYLAELPPEEAIPGSSEAEQLLHVARAYWKTYGQWPQATPVRLFGRLPKGMSPESWPTNPV
ncbi:MAG: hypothetical protein M0Z99_13825 [Betaproteobacteria bacterium]|nr:hypothetical protein [Betaproteobacteria bacterium]